jgi:hypothetical protein
MTKTSYIDMTSDESDLYFKGLQSGDRFAYGKIIRKAQPPSRAKIKGLTQLSLLPQVADVWNALTIPEKLAWTNAGAQCGLNGWRLFVQNMCARLEFGLSGPGTPSLLHQYKIGHINISAPASAISIIQTHPLSYYILRKVAGTKSQYEPVNIKEDFVVPLTIQLNCKTDLIASGVSPTAKFYAKIWYSYQGVDRYQNVEISLPLVHDWQTLSAVSPTIIGQIVAYDLYFTLQDVRGDLYFDNVKSIHSGQNWARDPNCNDINQTFTKIWYQIPKAWAEETLPDGASYGSIFPDVV